MRIAASADVHARAGDEREREVARIHNLFAGVADDAELLVLAGDLTDHGRPDEAETLLKGLDGVDVPVVTVLGNHDHESGQADELRGMLAQNGVHCLEHDSVVVEGVGFAGVKGFCGGFGDRLVRSFGEHALKEFVRESVGEAEALRAQLRALEAPPRVAILHYAPIEETVAGEPVAIHPFLGSSRLAEALDEGDARIAFHGHAHHGSAHGKTRGGVPVHNVSIPVLRSSGRPRAYDVFDV